MRLSLRILLAITALLPVRLAEACTISITGPQQTQLDREEWVVAGTVTGYAGPFTASGVEGEFWAIELAIVAAAHQPVAAKVVHVSRLDLAADCSTLGGSWAEIENAYPLGTTVLVVAWRSHRLPVQATPHLEASWMRGTAISTRIAPKWAIARRTDYAAVRELDQRAQIEQGYGPETTVVSEFEYHKELARLAKASRRQKRRIFERLIWSPFWFEGLVQVHLGDGPDAHALMKQYMERRPDRMRR